MSTEYSSGAGFGNKTNPEPSDMPEHEDTRFGKHDSTESYSGASNYGSGTTGGAGFGNKSSNDAPPPADLDGSNSRFTNLGTDPYTGSTAHGSGTTAGAGFGNKTGGFAKDSTLGKLMEKAGEVLHKDSLVEKGRERRRSQGYEEDAT